MFLFSAPRTMPDMLLAGWMHCTTLEDTIHIKSVWRMLWNKVVHNLYDCT